MALTRGFVRAGHIKTISGIEKTPNVHCQFPHVVTMLWQDSDNVVTSRRYKTMYLWHLDSYTVTVLYCVPCLCPCCDNAGVLLDALLSDFHISPKRVK